MKNKIFTIVFILLTIILCGCDDYIGIAYKNDFKKALEEAYFDGQRDAINGDVRIKLNNDQEKADDIMKRYFPFLDCSTWEENHK